MKQDERGLRLV